MKKTISLLSVIALTLCLALSLTSCNNDTDLVGNWETVLDIADYINEKVDSNDSDDDELEEYLEIDKFEMKISYTFKDDGTYVSEVDKDFFKKSADKYIADCKAGMNRYFEDLIKKQNLNMTVDELLAQANVDMDTMFDNAIDESAVEAFNGSGNYTAADGKLCMSKSLDTSPDENYYEKYEISGNKLTLSAQDDGKDDDDDDDDDDELADMFYPMVFTKVK